LIDVFGEPDNIITLLLTWRGVIARAARQSKREPVVGEAEKTGSAWQV